MPSLEIGLPHFILGIAALVAAIRTRRTPWNLAGAAIFLGALFMCHAASAPVWATLPLLKYVQFPWRFLGVAVFGAALCGADLLERIRLRQPRLELPLFLAGSVVVLLAYFPFYTGASFLVADARTNSLVQASPEQVKVLRAAGTLRAVDSVVTREKIRRVGERSTGGDEFLPISVFEKPGTPAPIPVSTGSGKVLQWDRIAFNSYRAKVSMSEDGKVQLHQFWFPGWLGTLDGRPIQVLAEGKSAIVSCDVPTGEHIVEFDYIGLPQRRVAIIASLASLALGALILARCGARQRQPNRLRYSETPVPV